MALLFGIGAAVLLGLSDFCAARASRTESFVAVTRTNMAVSAVLGPLLLLVKPWQWSTVDVAKGALAGLAMAGGLLLLYRGYTVARMGIVAPTSSVIFALVPVLWGTVRGDLPGVLVVVGMVVAMLALVPTTWTPGGAGSIRSGVILGLQSGVLFGIAFVSMSEVAEPAGLLPLWAQRVTGFALLAAIQPFEKSPLVITKMPTRIPAWAAGLAAILALTSLQLGYLQPGSNAVVSVATSQFATVLVILAFVFNHERLRWWQAVGVLTSGIGVGIMAAG